MIFLKIKMWFKINWGTWQIYKMLLSVIQYHYNIENTESILSGLVY